MTKMSNIILIGMPGCGKSTCGVLAAKIGCMKFLDTDLVIQENEGKRLQNIIDTQGEEYFARCEEKWVCSVNCDNTVIATGGSVVYSDKSMQHLKSLGKVVYLKISLEDMLKRINNFETRGILLHDGQTLEDMYAERCSLYERYADSVIECDNSSTVENTAHKIMGM